MATRSELLIDSRVEEVARTRRWLSEHASAEGFSDKEVRNLSLAVSEACVNIIKHAYGGHSGNPIELQLSIDETRLVLTIRDVGIKFDFEKYEAPNLSEPHESGYGVFIIYNLMDEVRYETSGEQGTTLTLVKHRSSSLPGDSVE